MFRLIAFFLVFAVFLVFIVLNLDNKCNVNFGFQLFNDVPVYITVFVSIFTGMVFAIPFFASAKKRKGFSKLPAKPGKKNKNNNENNDEIPGVNGPYGIN